MDGPMDQVAARGGVASPRGLSPEGNSARPLEEATANDVQHCCKHGDDCDYRRMRAEGDTKNIVELDAVAEESARLSFARVRKLIRVGRKESGKLGNTPRLGLLRGAHQTHPSRGLSRDLVQRPRQSGHA
ncbi:hypothetical protein B296_00045724 [Ensete ventricosum]|uniref:Uncharacterized protein n=1 Tax=Ensete ventricosum TaxID=4639 RepID=A0A426XBD9_ENSVE|nr:hypothetical protein B296_00045724 [Ensete ventricosum]